jgi:hypothetical protein
MQGSCENLLQQERRYRSAVFSQPEACATEFAHIQSTRIGRLISNKSKDRMHPSKLTGLDCNPTININISNKMTKNAKNAKVMGIELQSKNNVKGVIPYPLPLPSIPVLFIPGCDCGGFFFSPLPVHSVSLL